MQSYCLIKTFHLSSGLGLTFHVCRKFCDIVYSIYKHCMHNNIHSPQILSWVSVPDYISQAMIGQSLFRGGVSVNWIWFHITLVWQLATFVLLKLLIMKLCCSETLLLPLNLVNKCVGVYRSCCLPNGTVFILDEHKFRPKRFMPK